MAKVDAKQRFARGNRVQEFGSGSVKQRELDRALKEVGGRGSKGAQAARDFGQVARQSGEKAVRGEGGALARSASSRYNRVMTAIEKAASPRSARALMKGALRGMLSPAGVAEGVALDVAGRTAKPAREKMQDRAVEKVAKKSPGTAKAMSRANENRRKGA